MAKSFNSLVKRTTSASTRRKAAARTRELLEELLLAEIRSSKGRSQRDVANQLGIKQPTLAKIEKQSDMQIETLARIIRALGGELDIIARFPQGDVRIKPFGKRPRRAA
jgi:DNA-binding XRE family transcriptional regulator